MMSVVLGFLDLVVAVTGFHAVSSRVTLNTPSIVMADRVFAPAEAKGDAKV